MLGICSPQNSSFIVLSISAEGQTSSFGKLGLCIGFVCVPNVLGCEGMVI